MIGIVYGIGVLASVILLPKYILSGVVVGEPEGFDRVMSVFTAFAAGLLWPLVLIGVILWLSMKRVIFPDIARREEADKLDAKADECYEFYLEARKNGDQVLADINLEMRDSYRKRAEALR